MFKRKLDIDLPVKQSAFLWGARQTGKSSYLKERYSDAIYYDLLDTHELTRLTKEPWLLSDEVLALEASKLNNPIIIDEIQKIPELLNEVHRLIENEGLQFILCGSSARKLRTQATNLLGGRAWLYHFYPLTFTEIPDFDLLRAVQHGLLPKHYLAEPEYINAYLRGYIEVYLTEEIRNEGLVRNLQGFARFLDVAGMSNGEMINMNNIARDSGIDRATVQNYFQILVDTLLGYFVYPYRKKKKRDLISSTPKFYLFDVGVANYLGQQTVTDLKGSVFGKSFEHLVLMELQAYLDFNNRREELCYWRTKTGLEVDFVLGDAKLAIEVKGSTNVHQQDLKGLVAFTEEHPEAQAIVVSQVPRARILKLDNERVITILPWREFLTQLWQGQLF